MKKQRIYYLTAIIWFITAIIWFVTALNGNMFAWITGGLSLLAGCIYVKHILSSKTKENKK